MQTLFKLVLTAKMRLKMRLCVENPTLGPDECLVWTTHTHTHTHTVSTKQQDDITAERISLKTKAHPFSFLLQL